MAVPPFSVCYDRIKKKEGVISNLITYFWGNSGAWRSRHWALVDTISFGTFMLH